MIDLCNFKCKADDLKQVRTSTFYLLNQSITETIDPSVRKSPYFPLERFQKKTATPIVLKSPYLFLLDRGGVLMEWPVDVRSKVMAKVTQNTYNTLWIRSRVKERHIDV